MNKIVCFWNSCWRWLHFCITPYVYLLQSSDTTYFEFIYWNAVFSSIYKL